MEKMNIESMGSRRDDSQINEKKTNIENMSSYRDDSQINERIEHRKYEFT